MSDNQASSAPALPRPVFDEDHYGFIGGIYSEDIRDVRQIYQDMHDRLDALKVRR